MIEVVIGLGVINVALTLSNILTMRRIERDFQCEISNIKDTNKRRFCDLLGGIYEAKASLKNKINNSELSLRGNLVILEDNLQKININNTYLNPNDRQVVFVTVNENGEVLKVE